MLDSRQCVSCGAAFMADAPGDSCPKCRTLSASERPTQQDTTTSSTVPVSLPTTEQSGDQVGSYRLIEPLGEGGCGVVYLAEQKEPVRRRVALKLIKAGMDTKQVLARFAAERQALAMMDHPNIAKVLDAGATNAGRPFFVMELVKGERITEYCDKHQLATNDRLRLFIQVCHAIQHAHQKGIIHRDIKPSNILVTFQDATPIPKVIDFGIAKAMTGQPLTDRTVITAVEQFIGTPAYMSPEQAEMTGLDIDTRSDVYALGVLLYELLTGRTPFDTKELAAKGLDELRRIIREEEPLRPSTRLSSLDFRERTTVAKRRQAEAPKLIHLVKGELDWIVMKTLEKDRTRRYDTVAALAADIVRFLNDEPVLAAAPTLRYRAQKFVRRNRLAVGVTLAFAALLLGGITLTTRMAIIARHARDQEKIAKNQAQRDAQLAQAAARKAEQEELAALRNAYGWAMLKAQLDWDKNQLHEVQNVLENTRVYPDRGFEWDFWLRRCHLELADLFPHEKAVLAVAFAPDGRQFVTASKDGTLKVWDAASTRPVRTLSADGVPIHAAAYASDSQSLAAGTEDGTLHVWQMPSGRKLFTAKGHPGGITAVSISAESGQIATSGWDGHVMLWDTANDSPSSTFKAHAEPVLALAFSRDGRTLATGSWDQTLKLWDPTTQKERRQLTGHRQPVTALAFSSDSQALASASADGTVKLWETASGKESRTFQGHAGPVRSVAFRPDGKRIASAGADRTVKLWDAASGSEVLTLKGHRQGVRALAFSPDGTKLLSGGWDGAAKLWQATGSREASILQGHTGEVWSIAFSKDGRQLASSGLDGTSRVWDTQSGAELRRFDGIGSFVPSVAFTPDGRAVASGGSDKNPVIKLWDPATGQELFSFAGHTHGIRSIAFTPDGRKMATGGWDRSVRLWDVPGRRMIRQLTGHADTVRAVAFSADGSRLASAGLDRMVKIWDPDTGQVLHTFVGHSEGLTSLAFASMGATQELASASQDGTIRVWDVAQGIELRTLRGPVTEVWSVAYSPDGKRIVSGSSDGGLRVWEVSTGHELLTLRAPNEIHAVAFSPDGRHIAAGCFDRTIRIWEAATPQQVAEWSQPDRGQTVKTPLESERELTLTEERRQAGWVADEGVLKRWLVLGPIPSPQARGEAALWAPQIADEGRLQPRAGDPIRVGGLDLIWREFRSTDGILRLSDYLSAEKGGTGVAYAVAYVRVEEEQENAVLTVGSDDHALAYVNGARVYEHGGVRPLNPGQDRSQREFPLIAGTNVIVFKLVHEQGEGRAFVRVSDKGLKPLPGVRTLP